MPIWLDMVYTESMGSPPVEGIPANFLLTVCVYLEGLRQPPDSSGALYTCIPAKGPH